ncbi:type II toxin-antitoxin system RelE family toxin [Desulfonema magnum]|uniref:Toxin-antitoxin system, toxin component, RelE/ParE-like n=1 Tax=Desulfonema magnum TaxID=45655 RepID=A0A975BMI0_9BACT|nr:type II toxin-antitoxin system RelE/ParE family toxin [Desulfonema magnum]QTA88267.1 Toxin-antitoxin system, toxin component, RelE/ParE-like [Desulfonema magnum]
MSYRIEVSPEVRKEIRSLPGYVRTQARQLIRELGIHPRPDRAKELHGKPDIYRIWLAGRWRIAYEIDDEMKRLRILRVRKKEKTDYESL